jgi:hypothetical protein
MMLPTRISLLRTLCGAALAVSVGGMACSSSSPSGAPTGPADASTCDPAMCLPGNQCIDDGSGSGPQCHLVCTSQSGCPFNYSCVPAPAAGVDYCAADKYTFKQGPGVWGATCQPNKGINTNTACDLSQQFWCYAQSPTDGNAFCTRYSCASDADCAGGWWCATVNASPNATSTARSTGGTYTVCKPREYCAPCATDVDCPDNGDGVAQHCILDKNGTHYCAGECSSDSNCNNEAWCLTLNQAAHCSGGGGSADGGGETCVCAARAKECVGDGQLCSPCLSDKDCKNGLCVQADYSTELFCTVKSGVPCTFNMTTNMLTDQCPTTDEAKVPVGCTTAADGNDIPQNQCIGVVNFGTDPDTGGPVGVAGCFTPNR